MLDNVTSVVGAITGICALGVSIYVARQVHVVKVEINSRMTELLALTEKSSRAEGLKQGQEETR